MKEFIFTIYLLVWDVDFPNLAAQCVLFNIFVLESNNRNCVTGMSKAKETREIRRRFRNQTFLG